MKIYSKIEPGKLLHIIIRRQDIREGRTDLIPENQFIQCAALRLPKDATFRPHKHNWKPGKRKVIAQELWIVMNGSVKVTYYDTDDTVIHEDVLCAGDITCTLSGGHNYMILGDDNMVYEIKNGPYTGQQADKTFI